MMKTKPTTMLLMMIAGWMNRQQQEIIECLKAENENHKIFAIKWIGLTNLNTQARAKLRAKDALLTFDTSSPGLRPLS